MGRGVESQHMQMKPDTLKLVSTVHELFSKRKLTLSAAESCTGGLISHYVTAIPGASGFFIAAVVSYAAEIKRALLGVSPDIIREKGVVSAEMAVEMAGRMRLLSHTDYSVSTTGNLGPEVLEGKDRGLVYIAACREDRTEVRELMLAGSREENKEEAAVSALRLLVELVEEER